MLELPEVLTLARQANALLAGKQIKRVLPPAKPNKLCWFEGDPAEYNAQMQGQTILGGEGFGIFASFLLSNGLRLSVNDGVSPRLTKEPPAACQLLVEFTSGDYLSFTVAMYGGILLHKEAYENEYYMKSRRALSPLSPGFPARFYALLKEAKPSLSAKAFLATNQRFPGIGNGVLQDILLQAGLHPKSKVCTLLPKKQAALLQAVTGVLGQMEKQGGRSTEKDLLGHPGGYQVKLSKAALASGCPQCGGSITKEAYMGGAVYYCPACQAL